MDQNNHQQENEQWSRQNGYNQGGYNQNGYNQGGYNQNGYNQPYYTPPGYQPQNGNPYHNQPTGQGYEIASLICGIASILFCCCYGIPGIILGIVAIVMYRMYKSANNGVASAMAQAGMVCGIIGIVLGVLCIIYLVVAAVFMGIDGSYYDIKYNII